MILNYYLTWKKQRSLNGSTCTYGTGPWQSPFIMAHAWEERSKGGVFKWLNPTQRAFNFTGS